MNQHTFLCILDTYLNDEKVIIPIMRFNRAGFNKKFRILLRVCHKGSPW